MADGRTVDVQTLLNEHPSSGYQQTIFALCFCIILLDGFDTAAISYIAPSLIAEWGTSMPVGGERGWRMSMDEKSTPGSGFGPSREAAASVPTDETDRLISSSKVEGTAAYNTQGERLGTVLNFMVDKFTGQVAYAVMSFGGFLSLGEAYYPLPWKVLTYDTRERGYVVDLDRSKLEGAPSHKWGEEPDWSDQAFSRRVHDYYDLPLYFGAH